MELVKLTERICYLPDDPMRERPLLAHIRGERFSLAIDAGYSAEHLAIFYSALDAAGLPGPDFTALTHWHCDHSFALHAISGCGVACARTNEQLRRVQAENAAGGGYRERMMRDRFFSVEYAGDKPLVIAAADIEFERTLTLDLGGVTAELFVVDSPHTDDSVCVLVPEEGVLFLGDAIYGDYHNNAWIDPARLSRLVDTLERVEFEQCLPSHSHPHPKAATMRFLRMKLGGC